MTRNQAKTMTTQRAASQLRVGGTATYVGSNVGPGGAIKHGDRVRIVRIIGSAARIVPARLPATSKQAMRSAFLESGVGVSDAFLIPDAHGSVHMKKSARQLERDTAAALQAQVASGDEHARSVLNDLIEQRGGPKRADFSSNLKRMLRDLYGVKARIRTNATKNPFITAWTREAESPPFPASVRNTALDMVYGESFERNRDNPRAGNVEPFSIALKKPKWVDLFRRLGHRLEEI